MEEEWRPAVGYEGIYEVGSEGHVRRVTPGKGTGVGKILKPYIGPSGYPSVKLHATDGHAKTMRVHRIVALSFLSPRADAPEVNHKDGNKANSRLDNLEFVTPVENTAHAIRTGLTTLPRKVLTLEQEQAIKQEYRGRKYGSYRLGRKYGVSARTIIRVVRGVYREKYVKTGPDSVRVGRTIGVASPTPRMYGNLRYRASDEENRFVSCECGCGRQLLLYDKLGRPRRFICGHNNSRQRPEAPRKGEDSDRG